MTVLRKSEDIKKAFAEFDLEKVSKFGEAEREKLLHNKKIIRHHAKIDAAINNAKFDVAFQM